MYIILLCDNEKNWSPNPKKMYDTDKKTAKRLAFLLNILL